ncbi:MAG: DNA primase [Actinomycetota bacterium]
MAKINQQDIDSLRERADIVEVVSGYTALKRGGTNTMKGLCPFHSEKTPSFTVDRARGLFYCFGCQVGGDLYKFVEKIENLPFPEAVEWVARRFAFELRYEEMRPGEQAARGLKARLLEANAEAASFFHRTLMNSPDAAEARRYLKHRGFGREVAERWQLGYAPGRNALCSHLRDKGFSEREIEQADLGRRSERDRSLYDTFRQRITFPTWNLQGGVAGFGARAMGDAQPKYLNTSETPVFSKSRVMYGLNRAKSSIARGSDALVVEGYTDVIALQEAGIEEAVATNGVALSETHFEQLKKFGQRAILMLDSDAAGQGATERSFDTHHRLGIEVLVATLPPGRDPAEMIATDGPDGIRKVIGGAQPLLEFKIDQLLHKAQLDTPEARSRAVREVAQVLGWHPDPIARHEYAFMAARRIGVDPEAVQRALAEGRVAPGASGDASGREQDRRLPGHVKVEREALQLLLTRAREIDQQVGMIAESDFTSPARRELFRTATALAASDRERPLARLADGLSPDALSLFTELTVGVEGSDEEDLAVRCEEIFVRIKVFSLERNIKKRRDELGDINPVVDPTRHDDLFTELVKLEAERRDLLRRIRGAA